MYVGPAYRVLTVILQLGASVACDEKNRLQRSYRAALPNLS